ncbi:ABC transporter permease [Kocuria sp.]|uniref:ABC transporter permease n=1 Tax=Kocuria sp. TaxID=1871328 RepID=UPI0026E062C3|nr:ABC transporter permease [Kocuria sp.]MDO5617993.1 ABC transporter permease [Kocuria sp.]
MTNQELRDASRHDDAPWAPSDAAGDGAATPSRRTEDSPGRQWAKTAGVVAGLVIVVSLMLLAFLLPAINSGAKDLPLAVSGPDAAVTALTDQLNTADPEAFEITTYDSTQSVQTAVENRDAIGGISVQADGVVITTASGAGAPYSNMLQGIGSGLEQAGQTGTYQDVAPFPEDDPTGTAMTSLALPLVFGGMISAVVLSTVLKGRPWHRLVGALVFAALAGTVVAAILQFGLNAMDAQYWAMAGAIAATIAAISLTIIGLASLFGAAGLGVGAVVMMFVANPLSGIAAGADWLPAPWGAGGQLLPLGAGETIIRSVAYFDGAGTGSAPWVVLCWATVGVMLIVAAAWRDRRRHSSVAS